MTKTESPDAADIPNFVRMVVYAIIDEPEFVIIEMQSDRKQCFRMHMNLRQMAETAGIMLGRAKQLADHINSSSGETIQ